MSMEAVLSIVGGFLVVVGAVNAFFLKGILSDLNAVKIELAKIAARNEDKSRRLLDVEANQKEIFIRLNKLEKE